MASQVGSDIRTVDRTTGGTSGPSGTDVTVGGTATPIPAHGHGHGGGVTVVGGLSFDAPKFDALFGVVLTNLRAANEGLKALVPAQFWEKLTFHGTKQEAPDFINTMADVQEKHADLIGKLNTNPMTMRQGTQLAVLIGGFLTTLHQTVTVMSNIQNFSLDTGLKEGRLIYRRAVIAAETHPELADAIARFRNILVRAGKKGAQTRKLKTKGKQASPPPAPTPHESSTTVTTSQK